MEAVPVGGRPLTAHTPFFFSLPNEECIVAVEGQDVIGVELESQKMRFRLHHKSPLVFAGAHPADSRSLVTITEEGELGKWLPEAELLQVSVQLDMNGLKLGGLVETSEERLLAAVFITSNGRLFLIRALSKRAEDNPEPQLLATDLPTDPQRAQFTKRYCVYVVDDKLHLRFYYKQKGLWHKIGSGRKFTCVAAEEETGSVAAGDDTGRILIWQSAEKSGIRDVSQIVHWHTLGVSALAWSPGGGCLVSGGGERVLLRSWLQREGKDTRETLPRLPAAITRISLHSNGHIAVGLADNSIRLVSPDFQLFGGPIGSILGGEDNPLGLVPDPYRNWLWTNAGPGFIQAFCPHSVRLLFHLDVSRLNDAPAERSGQRGHVTVTGLALSASFLLTLESLHDPDLQLRTTILRLWRRNKMEEPEWSEQQAAGSSQLDSVSLAEVEGEPRVATTGEDGLRLWAPHRNQWLQLPFVALSYHGLLAKCVALSEDGSVVAAGYGKTVVLYAWATPPSLPPILDHFRSIDSETKSLLWKGDQLIVGYLESVVVWNTGSGSSRVLISASSPIRSVALSHHHLLTLQQGPDEQKPSVLVSEIGLDECGSDSEETVARVQNLELVSVAAVNNVRLALSDDQILYRLCGAEEAESIKANGVRVKEAPTQLTEPSILVLNSRVSSSFNEKPRRTWFAGSVERGEWRGGGVEVETSGSPEDGSPVCPRSRPPSSLCHCSPLFALLFGTPALTLHSLIS